ncbi:MAG TPA: CheR family methyltransferase, partial [Longimicrobium sp.]|nr:CheR family methyltransferase [Longimicrobium sp.]
ALLAHVKESRGTDFRGYKRSTLGRRFRRRMDEVGVETYPAYADWLDAHPDEFTALFNTILINVTSFFRDPEAWEALTREVLEPLAERRTQGPIRVWSAGCASGEETYTLVMALAEVLGTEAVRERVKVYATDMDDEALAAARMGAYPAAALEAIPEPLRARYFEEVGERFVFRPELRRQVIFGRHDLAKDAPISHLDLLVSRNTLMYFTAEVQSRILQRFHYGLDDQGALFLGKAEMLRTHGALFAPLNLKARIFTRVNRAPVRDRLRVGLAPGDEAGLKLREELRLREAALDADQIAQVVVSPEGRVVLANAPARTLFGLTPVDVGRPLHELTLSYRPLELRSLVEQVAAERRPLSVERVDFAAPGRELRSFEVHISPLADGQTPLGVSIAFSDVTTAVRLQVELHDAHQELETAFEELQSTNEELETTNEELQSTNEELETLNDELQSTNEEMETVNLEMTRRGGELNAANVYLDSILASLRLAVVVVDDGGEVRLWNRGAEELWGVRAEQTVGRPLLGLEIGMPLERLKGAVREAIGGRPDAEEMVLEGTDRRGHPVVCRVTVTPFRAGRKVAGAVLVMEEQGADRAVAEPAR